MDVSVDICMSYVLTYPMFYVLIYNGNFIFGKFKKSATMEQGPLEQISYVHFTEF